jgi:sterol desaturase/sphingolipid hydroxylase (fatty acid hydroxylase superfamily)
MPRRSVPQLAKQGLLLIGLRARVVVVVVVVASWNFFSGAIMLQKMAGENYLFVCLLAAYIGQMRSIFGLLDLMATAFHRSAHFRTKHALRMRRL